jgi:hypothetical protein
MLTPFYWNTVLSLRADLPAIIVRMKQSDNLPGLGVGPRNVRPLETIAVSTGQSKVALCRRASMFLRNNVIDLERQRKGKLRNETVFAATGGAVSLTLRESGYGKGQSLRQFADRQ